MNLRFSDAILGQLLLQAKIGNKGDILSILFKKNRTDLDRQWFCILECVFEFRGGQNPFHDDRDQHRDPIGLNRLKGSQVQTGSFWQPGVLHLLL